MVISQGLLCRLPSFKATRRFFWNHPKTFIGNPVYSPVKWFNLFRLSKPCCASQEIDTASFRLLGRAAYPADVSTDDSCWRHPKKRHRIHESGSFWPDIPNVVDFHGKSVAMSNRLVPQGSYGNLNIWTYCSISTVGFCFQWSQDVPTSVMISDMFFQQNCAVRIVSSVHLDLAFYIVVQSCFFVGV